MKPVSFHWNAHSLSKGLQQLQEQFVSLRLKRGEGYLDGSLRCRRYQAPRLIRHLLMQYLVSMISFKEKISNPSVSHHYSKDSYVNQLSESFIHLVQNARRFMYEILDRVQVVECDQQNVFGPRAQQHLVFESHGHKVIQLQNNTGKWWFHHNPERHGLSNFTWMYLT